MRWSLVGSFGCLGVVMLGGCTRPSPSSEASPKTQVTFEWNIAPTPPQTGTARCSLLLRDGQKKPLTGAKVHLEGDMSHPGMQPSLADMKETKPGRYVGNLDFTMGGDWFISIEAKLTDGETWQHQINVSNVKTAK